MNRQEDVRRVDGRDSVVASPDPELPLTILQLDQQGCVRSSTSGAFGRDLGDLIGARLQDLLTPGGARRLDHVLRAAEEGGVFRLTVRGRDQRSTQRLFVARSHHRGQSPATYSVIVSPTALRRLAAVSSSDEKEERRRILIADDEPMLLQLSCRVLEQAGFETTPVLDGRAVLDALEADHDIGLVILDLSLPGPTTPELIRRIRALERPPRILLATGRPVQELEELLDRTRVPDHLQKPYPNEVLIQTVERLIDS